MSDKKHTGKYDIPMEHTVLPEDKALPIKLPWKIIEYQGTEIFKPFKGWVKKFQKEVDKHNCYGRLLDKYAIKKLKGIKLGDEVIVSGFIGDLGEANITELDYETKEGTAENEFYWFPLKFGGDDRNVLVATMQLGRSISKNINKCN